MLLLELEAGFFFSDLRLSVDFCLLGLSAKVALSRPAAFGAGRLVRCVCFEAFCDGEADRDGVLREEFLFSFWLEAPERPLEVDFCWRWAVLWPVWLRLFASAASTPFRISS